MRVHALLARCVALGAASILAAACGGNVVVDGNSGGVGGGSGSGTTGSTGSVGSTGSAASTGSAGSTGSTGSTGSSASTGTGGAGPGNAVYSADAYPGGLDHILFKKADAARNICVQLFLASPIGSSPGFAFSLPPKWGVGSARVTNKASDCDSPWPGMGQNPVNANGGKGVVSFTLPPGGYFPCDMSVHAVLTFPPGPAWVPAQEPLDADMVPIKSGCF